MLPLQFVAFFLVLNLIESTTKMEQFVVGGSFASIERFPHSAFLGISCLQGQLVKYWVCSSSIVNQQIILTAAHCLEYCMRSSAITVWVGHKQKRNGLVSSAVKFKMHPKYKTISDVVHFDIALLKLKTRLHLDSTVKRVALMRNPPYNEMAYVAVWGMVDEVNKVFSGCLKQTNQTVMSRDKCQKVLEKTLPIGCICGGSKYNKNYAAQGDSGSALVVRGYIQIGIVSYKYPQTSASVVVYTDISHFYDWINVSVKKMYCS